MPQNTHSLTAGSAQAANGWPCGTLAIDVAASGQRLLVLLLVT
jgi:hypothetical protein